jgi:uncharacterized membrane protein YraQ (UPF0718 family)
MQHKVLPAWRKTQKTILMTLPLITGVVLLIGLLNSVLKSVWLIKLFGQNIWLNSLLGASLGSLAAGNPITSYILAGELNQVEVGLATITAFILTWVTVGVIQLPAESIMLGKKFAILRNILSFVSAILIGWLTQLILN